MTQIAVVDEASPLSLRSVAERYEVYLELGHLFSLADDPNVFPVSTAGLALGNQLLRDITKDELDGALLDLGTGSGVQAMLLRGMGATRIVATDVSAHATAIARENEIFNFGDSIITYQAGPLFDAIEKNGDNRFDLIVFNPPGWRAPSEALKSKLRNAVGGLDLNAMFYGDAILVDFLTSLPDHLSANGRAIVGFNSLVGIADVIRRANARVGQRRLRLKLIERIEIPLLFYTPSWQSAKTALLDEFDHWRRSHRSAFSNVDGQFKWFYEITEVTVAETPAAIRGAYDGVI